MQALLGSEFKTMYDEFAPDEFLLDGGVDDDTEDTDDKDSDEDEVEGEDEEEL